MSILTTGLLRKNLDFAISNLQINLNPVRPVVTVTYAASRQNIDSAFAVFEDGREEVADTRFYIDAKSYANLPQKGWILSDGTRRYKVMRIETDAYGVGMRLDCGSEFTR